MNAVELFAGAGGLALGTSHAGFQHGAVIEQDRNACDTIRENNRLGVIDWPLHECDVRQFDFRPHAGADLVAGGPPCQPFSIGGKHRGHNDRRNLFPEAVRAVREIQPRAILLENVKGLLREAFAEFFQYVVLQLSHPELMMRDREDWLGHLARLKRHHARGKVTGLAYDVVFKRMNAADYGIPQKRERVFLVGFRRDIDVNWVFPRPTHSLDALLYDQWVTGEYWDRHKVAKKNRGEIPPRFRCRLREIQCTRFWPDARAWRTVRDAIADLPDPRLSKPTMEGHLFNPGARVYGGHTGSPIDEPAKTLKAGDHGVPGGENMLAFPSGEVRYFTVRESARLQTFPDTFIFKGSWTEAMRQLGNAVPVDLAAAVATQVKGALEQRNLEHAWHERENALQSA